MNGDVPIVTKVTPSTILRPAVLTIVQLLELHWDHSKLSMSHGFRDELTRRPSFVYRLVHILAQDITRYTE